MKSTVPGPLTKTFDLLTASTAPEALDLLVIGLESGCEPVSLGAALALLERSGVQGQREVMLRYSHLPAAVQHVMQSRAERFDALLRQLLIQGGPEQRQEGMDGIRWLRAVDQVPQLIQLMCRNDVPELDAVARCLQDLVLLIDEDIRATSVTDASRNAVLGRRDKLLMHLDQAISNRYESLQVKDPVIESILILGPAQHPTVKKVLWQAAADCRERAGRMLLSSPHPKVIRQATDSLKQSYPHPKAFEAVQTRVDVEFICELARAMSGRTGSAFEKNLKQIDRLAWLETAPHPFGLIPETLQASLLSLVFSTKVSAEQKALLQDWLLRHGGPEGRMAAADKVALVDENVMQEVLVDSLDAQDEHVQAWAVTQLRQHAVPEAFGLLLERLESPLPEVRAAAQAELSDFNLERVLGLLDALDKPAARRVGALLCKIDELAIPKLQRELETGLRPRRMRAAQAAVRLGLEKPLLQPLLSLADDEDVMIRRLIAELLGSVAEPEAATVLERLAEDDHPRVRETALRALTQWNQIPADHRIPVLA